MPHFVIALTDHSGVPALTDWRGWLVLLALVLLGVSPVGRFAFARITPAARRLADRPAAAIVSVGLLSLLIGAGLSMMLAIPAPAIHDEFSYLLAGETFASGRLTNPTHPMWQHFESFHIFHQPTYMSKYPPGQGLALALGIVTAGLPIAGAWLTVAAGCAAVCWMLYAFLPPRWAMAGGMMMAISPLAVFWGQSYWGGGVPLLGGALVFGGLRRTIGRPGVASSLAMGAGLVILGLSRPYEGLLVGLPVGIVLLVWLAGDRQWVQLATRVVVPLVLALAGGLTFLGYYNWRVTGQAMRMPYAVHDAAYGQTPHFVFQPLRPSPGYRHKELAYLHGEWDVEQWRKQQSAGGWAVNAVRKTGLMASAWLQPWFLVIPLLMLPRVLRDHWLALAAAVVAWFGAGMLIVTWNLLPHYTAPVVPLVVLLIVACAGRLWEHPKGQMALRAVALTCILVAVLAAHQRWAQEVGHWHARRAMIQRTLEDEPGYHLVIVRYAPGHNHHADWVFNAADIDRARVVWAREMGPEKDAELIRHFSARRVWLLEVSNERASISDYRQAQGNTRQGGW